MTNILLRLSWCLPQEVKRVEVTCHLMYADFSCVSFYTLEVRKWVAHGEQCLSLLRSLQVVQPFTRWLRDIRRTTMELREQSPTTTEVRNLEYAGFSSEEIASLFRVKALYQHGAYHEATPEHKRLAFVRWLYLQGRLES
jgi:hypothetical protein